MQLMSRMCSWSSLLPSWSRSVRMATLSLLYFLQGAPYGFQSACLPIILREAGQSFTALGAMKLLLLPWVCRSIYAPIIERTRTKGELLLFRAIRTVLLRYIVACTYSKCYFQTGG